MSEITKPIMLDETGKEIIEALKGISRHAATADMASDSEKLGGKEPSEYLGTGDVPEWAKQPNKPTYTASDVGALPSDGKAVDSDKLNGHPASDYATTATVTALADDVSVSKAELQALGWCVPSEMPIKNSFAGGVLTQYVQRVDLGTLNWEYPPSDEWFQCVFPNKGNNNLYCDKYTTNSYMQKVDKTIGCNTGYLVVNDRSYNSVSAFVSSVKGVYLYYELATPIQHNITDMPSQKSMISDEWDSAKTYAVGAYVIDENQLYKCIVQNSGQKPKTANTYWQRVKVTDAFAKLNLGGFSYSVEGIKSMAEEAVRNYGSAKDMFATFTGIDYLTVEPKPITESNSRFRVIVIAYSTIYVVSVTNGTADNVYRQQLTAWT